MDKNALSTVSLYGEVEEVYYPPSRVSRILFVCLYTLQLIGSIYFLHWLRVEGFNHESPLTSILFIWAEIIAFISSAFFLSCGLFVLAAPKVTDDEIESTENDDLDDDDVEIQESEAPDVPSDFPTVALCVCRYQEPLEDLIRTVECMNRIDWPKEKLQIYILDDGWHSRSAGYQREQLSKLMALLGGNAPPMPDRVGIPAFDHTGDVYRPDCATECQYLRVREGSDRKSQVTLIARKKPPTSHYKAGNVNNFLYNYLGEAASMGEPCPEYTLILDHDMLPNEDIVVNALSQLEADKNLAFIQYPQRFYDIKGSDQMYAGNEIFFDGVQVNRGYVGLAAFAGTNAVWRNQALYHVGGFQYGSLTEDASTGLAVHMLGYTSAYSQKELAVGQSPQTVEDAMQQRMRWSQGAVEILFKHVTAYCRKLSPIDKSAMAPDLSELYNAPKPEAPPRWRKFFMFIIYFDSMIYPLYSMGYLLHVVVCLLYLLNIQAPIAPENPIRILLIWLPLYVIKAACQLFAFPSVSLSAQWNSQMAWAGYSLSTLASVGKAIMSKFQKGFGGWFNTGAGSKKRFLVQYGNTAIALTIYGMIVYRVFAFVFLDDTCFAWMSIGALMYCLIILLHVQGWAAEPFRSRNVKENAWHLQHSMRVTRSSLVKNQTVSRGKSWHSRALEKAHRHREEHHSFDLSLIFIFCNVILVSFILFFWADGNCDRGVTQPRSTRAGVQLPAPPLHDGLNFTAEFKAVNGGLELNDVPFTVKGINWFGFETERNIPYGLDVTGQDEMMQMLVREGFNSIRLPLAVESILRPDRFLPVYPDLDYSLNPHYPWRGSYVDNVKAFVDRAASWGVVTLLDMHRLRNDNLHEPLPYDDQTSFEQVKDAWTTLATEFCDSWAVMGADLKNEPIDVTWGDGSATDWRLLSEELAQTVSSVCPKWLIFVEGGYRMTPQFNPMNDDIQLAPWGSMLVKAGQHPVRLVNPEKLVYSPHIYGPGTLGDGSLIWNANCDDACLAIVCNPNADAGNNPDAFCRQLITSSETPFPSNIPTLYDFLFGYLKTNSTVVVGEWGGTYLNPVITEVADPVLARGLETQWNDAVVDYMIESKFGSFFWCLNPESDDTGGLVLDDWLTIDTAKQALLRRLPSTDPLQILEEASGLERCLRSTGNEYLSGEYASSRFDAESVTYNSAYDRHQQGPRMIIFPKNEAEVRRAVQCAILFEIGICPRSGGNSYTGDSSCSGILVDLRHLRGVERVSEDQFWIGTGIPAGQLQTQLFAYDRMIPVGNNGGIGSGFLLGCGYGYLSRVHGLGCEQIVAARLVTPEGRSIEVTESNEHSELLWALRGAGSGQFGIVTELLLETYPSTEQYSFFSLSYPRSSAASAVSVWQDWALDPSNNVTSRLFLWNQPDYENWDAVTLEGVFPGELDELESLLEEPIAVLGEPNLREVSELDYGGLLARLFGIPDGDVLQIRNPYAGFSGSRRSFYNRAQLIPEVLDSGGIEDLLYFLDVPSSQPYQDYILLMPFGGAIADPIRPNAFGHRDALGMAQYSAYWNDPTGRFAAVSHQKRLHRTMSRYWGTNGFYNYKDDALDNWEEAYWGEASVDRLRSVKCRYDPQGMFSTHAQSIPPSDSCATEQWCLA